MYPNNSIEALIEATSLPYFTDTNPRPHDSSAGDAPTTQSGFGKQQLDRGLDSLVHVLYG